MYFIKILRFLLRIVSTQLFNLKLIYLSEFFSSLRATILLGKFVKVNMMDRIGYIHGITQQL